MINVVPFYFSRFGENSYLVFDHTKECLIIDPGCYTQEEQDDLFDYIKMVNLKPIMVLNTHCHIDHILGNQFFLDSYDIPLGLHSNDLKYLEVMPSYGKKHGLDIKMVDENRLRFLEEGDDINIGESSFKVIHTPGHTPGSISFFNERDKVLISGDVIFNNRIGRVDLAGGDLPTLQKTISEKILVLDDQIIIYPGHGVSTTVGYEKINNLMVCNWA